MRPKTSEQPTAIKRFVLLLCLFVIASRCSVTLVAGALIEPANVTLVDDNHVELVTKSSADRDNQVQVQVQVCHAPPPIANARPVRDSTSLKLTTFTVGTTLEFECLFGFEKVAGNSTLECKPSDVPGGVAGWQGTPPTCQSELLPFVQVHRSNQLFAEIKCDDPGFLPNAKRIGYTFTVLSNVTYECEEGYRMVGKPMLSCRANKQWDRDKPRCESELCN